MSSPMSGPVTEFQSHSLLKENRSTLADAEALRQIANGTLHEANAHSHIIRLMLQCADLRRRLEGATK